MKKGLIVLFVTIFMMVGCSSSSDEEQKNDETEDVTDNEQETKNERKEASTLNDLNLQVLKEDQEVGVTIENNKMYSYLQELIDQDPTVGVDNDFTIRTMDIIEMDKGGYYFAMIGINRTGVSMKNMTFHITLSNAEGEPIKESTPFELKETDVGPLETDSAVPILMSITEEERQAFLSLDKGDLQVTVENFDAELLD